MRELIFGPKRFGQLREGLRGISPNVLSQRLHDLEMAGLLGRQTLDPPASVAVYELTVRGQALEPVLIELGRWGSREAIRTSAGLSASALLVALKTAFDPAARMEAVYGLGIEGEWFTLTVVPGSIEIRAGRPGQPGATLSGDRATLRAVAFGREPVASSAAAGRLTVSGDREVALAFPSLFRVPAPAIG